MPRVVGVISPVSWARMILWAWKMLLVRSDLEAMTTEAARLKKQLGKKSESIWDMTKVDLVEVARKEWGMTMAKAEKETVVTLRERIRAQRAVQSAPTDPLAVKPVGLSGMTKENLIKEMETRGLPVTKNITRPSMQVQITDDVERRAILSGTTATVSYTHLTLPTNREV